MVLHSTNSLCSQQQTRMGSHLIYACTPLQGSAKEHISQHGVMVHGSKREQGTALHECQDVLVYQFDCLVTIYMLCLNWVAHTRRQGDRICSIPGDCCNCIGHKKRLPASSAKRMVNINCRGHNNKLLRRISHIVCVFKPKTQANIPQSALQSWCIAVLLLDMSKAYVKEYCTNMLSECNLARHECSCWARLPSDSWLAKDGKHFWADA